MGQSCSTGISAETEDKGCPHTFGHVVYEAVKHIQGKKSKT